MFETERVRASVESSTDANAPRTNAGVPEAEHDGVRSAGAMAAVRPRATILARLHHWWILFVAGALLLIFGPPVLLVAWLVGRREWVYPLALWGARQWLRLSGMRVRVRGLEQLDPRQTYIFIANHRSYLDTATLFAYTGRRIGLFAKKELLKVPILGVGMGFVNIMAIDRSNRERALTTVRAATESIRSGVSFGVFAEGTRARPGQLLPFKKGAFYMAIETGVSVVPVAMKNTDRLMGKGEGTAYPGTIEMVVLPPVETKGLSTDEDVKRLTAEVRALIAEELER
ncbi:MAG TPA: lysophospholipid acyltransferase family protein [Pyrinomonadaceae bacterium]|jgi:1-acyl-sn-glycerol-3-phosphate acyltransferase|nr:lysophospholipid acyltransferase family protein [Pyrinomonadaceae bacterium]